MAHARLSVLLETIAAGAALAVAVGIGCGRAEKPITIELPKPPAIAADAAAKSQVCMECHVQIVELIEGDKHIAKGLYCVVCHGGSMAHVEAEVEGAMPDRSWRRWLDEENQYEWRMKNATLEIARYCASCHGRKPPRGGATKTINWDHYLGSPHGRAVRKGSADAPTCTDCHRAHGLGREPWTDETIVEVCAICHGDEEMMKRAGLDLNVVRDFKAGRHSIMAAVPAEQKSSCIKCHHPHQ